MEKKPQLLIIAGPNGAGKSTISKTVVEELKLNVIPFDFDKEYHRVLERFSHDPSLEQGCWDATMRKFKQEFDKAIASKENYCFETNFNSKEVLKYVQKARKQDYRVSLYFIALRSTDFAKSRVDQRVAKGGHYVSPEVIEARYYEGFNMLNTHYSLFDLVVISESLKSYKVSPKYMIWGELVIRFTESSFKRYIPAISKKAKSIKLKLNSLVK